MESNLARAIESYHDDQPEPAGPWANAWTPVWENMVMAHSATPHRWIGLSAAQVMATFTPANAPEAEQEETLYV